MAELKLEKAKSSDIDQIEKLYNESIDWLISNDIHQWKRGVYPTRESALEAFKKGCIFCCRNNGEISGTVILNDIQPPQYKGLDWKTEGRALVIHTLIVKPSFCGHGAATFIMNSADNYAFKNGYDCIRLDAFPGNHAAIFLYSRLGFKRVGKVFFDIKDPGFEWYDCFEKRVSRKDDFDADN